MHCLPPVTKKISPLAQQPNDDYHWGLLDEAIAKADIDNEGIRNSPSRKEIPPGLLYDAAIWSRAAKIMQSTRHFGMSKRISILFPIQQPSSVIRWLKSVTVWRFP